MLYVGIPRKRRKGIPGANKLSCATCGTPGLSIDMVWLGGSGVRALVHPECADLDIRPSNTARSERPAYIQQPMTYSQDTHSADITVTAAIFTGAVSTLTVAQATATPTVYLTGTNFDTRTYGRVNQGGPSPDIRTTTYIAPTSITFTLRTEDIYPRTLSVGAVKINPGWHQSAAITTLSITA